MKNILLIATGGTIASTNLHNGLTPTFDADKLLSYIPELKTLCHISGISIMSIDSTNMNPSLMVKIAKTIDKYYDKYDGFVISHGTDTLAYTSSALTYMLPNIKKPVVLVGAQKSISSLHTDAKKNVTDAFLFALEGNAGVFVAFDGKIMLGCRVKKLKTRSIDAFASVNLPNIAFVKSGKIVYNDEFTSGEYKAIFNNNSSIYQIKTKLSNDIMIIKMFPGIKEEIFDFIKNNYKGVIIESFGIGGIPNKDPNIVEKVKELIDAGLAVVITTQCLEEGIDLNVYEVGQILSKYSIIYAGNMNIEAITMKLMWAIANLNSLEKIKEFMEEPYFGDITFN